MDEEERAARIERQRALLALVGTLLSLATVVLAVYPDLPTDLYYQFRLWLAHRDGVNYDRLRYARQRAEATGETADRIIPAEVQEGS